MRSKLNHSGIKILPLPLPLSFRTSTFSTLPRLLLYYTSCTYCTYYTHTNSPLLQSYLISISLPVQCLGRKFIVEYDVLESVPSIYLPLAIGCLLAWIFAHRRKQEGRKYFPLLIREGTLEPLIRRKHR